MMREKILFLLPFLFGLCIGSFLNVLIYRLPRSLSIMGRSSCPNCKKKISWFDNIPLLSFIFLKGKCRYCHAPISIQYPIVELLTALFTVVITNYILIYNLAVGIYSLLIIYSLIVIFFSDFNLQIIPDQIIFSAIIFSLIYRFIFNNSEFNNYLLAGIFGIGVLGLVYLITHGRGMGFGDVKLAGLMGLILGFPYLIIAFYLAFLTGGIFGVILVLSKRKKLKDKVAFGPFLAMATIIVFFGGEIIWQKIIKDLLYLNL